MTALVRAVPLRPPRSGRFLGAMLAVSVPVAVAGLTARPSLRPWHVTNVDVAAARVKQFAFEAYPSWAATPPARTCPSIEQLGAHVSHHETRDPWGTDYCVHCKAGLVMVHSFGEDRLSNTADDVWSH